MMVGAGIEVASVSAQEQMASGIAQTTTTTTAPYPYTHADGRGERPCGSP